MNRLAVSLSLLVPAGLLAAPDQETVLPGQKVSELLTPGKEPAGAALAPERPDGSSAFRLFLGAGALLVLGGVVLAARRRRGRFAGAPRIEPIDVLGRAALSSRHAIYIVRAAGRRIVLGVAGERMTALAVIEERAADTQAPPPRGFTSRLGDVTRRLPAKGGASAELEPYRKQVDRLRGMLRGPFGGGRGSPEEP